MASTLLLLLALGLPSADAACEVASGVRINEAMVDPQGADAGFEWIELVNLGPLTVELEGWEIESATSPDARFANAMLIPPGVTVAPGEHLVIGDLSVVFPEVYVVNVDQVGQGFGNNATNEDALRLVDCTGGVQDLLVYGDVATPPFFVDLTGAVIGDLGLAPASDEGMSIARLPGRPVTGDSAADFTLTTPSPGHPNDFVPEPGGGGGGLCAAPGVVGEVVINELLPAPGVISNPEGTDSGYEWLELYNPGPGPVDLSGWRIHQAGKAEDWGSRVRFTIPDGTRLGAGKHLVLSDPLAAFPESVTALRLASGSLGLGNSPSAVRLVDCADLVIDQVVYGGENPGLFLDGQGQVIDDDAIGPEVRDDLALARRADGLDTDVDADDFTVAPPTPGEANADLSCKETSGPVRINEFMPNPDGSNTENRQQFVELFNAGDEAVDISTWTIRRASDEESSRNPTVVATLPGGTVIEPGGFLVVATLSSLLDLDDAVFVDELSLDSGTNGGLVALYACDGDRIDGVVYGGANSDGVPEDDGAVEVNGAPYPSEDACIVRREDGVDTNVSQRDFVMSLFCTAGLTNDRGGGGGGSGTTNGPQGGCFGSGPRDVEPRVLGEGGCSAVGARLGGGAWVWALALVTGRARRRTAARG